MVVNISHSWWSHRRGKGTTPYSKSHGGPLPPYPDLVIRIIKFKFSPFTKLLDLVPTVAGLVDPKGNALSLSLFAVIIIISFYYYLFFQY